VKHSGGIVGPRREAKHLGEAALGEIDVPALRLMDFRDELQDDPFAEAATGTTGGKDATAALVTGPARRRRGPTEGVVETRGPYDPGAGAAAA
jgi:hypothetical protein